MPQNVECPICGFQFAFSGERAGEHIRCSHCGETFMLEGSDEPTLRFHADADAAEVSVGNASDPQAVAELPEMLGRFKIRKRLGRGGFGVVYLAYDPVLDRDVALKVPHAAALERADARARALREPKAAAQLRHPHIVPVFDAGFDGERFFIASAYIEGKTLSDAIAQQPIGFRRAAEIVQQLADGLNYAAQRGIIHRDVKPANIMLDTRGEPHLMDFGLARFEDSQEKLTHDGWILGTPSYMSPEQAKGVSTEITAASDQYSLGSVPKQNPSFQDLSIIA